MFKFAGGRQSCSCSVRSPGGVLDKAGRPLKGHDRGAAQRGAADRSKDVEFSRRLDQKLTPDRKAAQAPRETVSCHRRQSAWSHGYEKHEAAGREKAALLALGKKIAWLDNNNDSGCNIGLVCSHGLTDIKSYLPLKSGMSE